MWLSILAIPAGALLGFGFCGYLAYGDTKLGVHPNTMGGPKQRKRLLRSYMALGLIGVAGWFAVTETATDWLTIALGFVGALFGRWVFNRLDRRMTRYVG